MEILFDILAKQYRPMLITYLTALVRDANLAEDLTQETLLAAYESLGRYEEGRDFGAWLRGIARNKTMQNQRAAARHRLIVDSRVIEGMEEIYSVFDSPHAVRVTWDDRVEVLRRCTSKLARKLRDAVTLVYGEGRSLGETATALSSTPEAIGQRVLRARVLLLQCAKIQLEQNRG